MRSQLEQSGETSRIQTEQIRALQEQSNRLNWELTQKNAVIAASDDLALLEEERQERKVRGRGGRVRRVRCVCTATVAPQLGAHVSVMLPRPRPAQDAEDLAQALQRERMAAESRSDRAEAQLEETSARMTSMARELEAVRSLPCTLARVVALWALGHTPDASGCVRCAARRVSRVLGVCVHVLPRQMLETLEEERKARREADAEVARLQSRVDAGSSTRTENHEAIGKLKLQVRKLMAQRDRLRKQVDQGRVRAQFGVMVA